MFNRIQVGQLYAYVRDPFGESPDSVEIYVVTKINDDHVQLRDLRDGSIEKQRKSWVLGGYVQLTK